MNDMYVEVEMMDDDGEVESLVALPAKYEVCSNCKGHGMVLNEAMRFHAYTQEEFEDFSDDDREQYFTRGGCYDVTCPTCDGKRVEKVVNERECRTPEQKAALKRLRECEDDDREYERLCRMERMMGA